jgi:DNA-directed RNA polymerase subunit N (RpoN/RPB10)
MTVEEIKKRIREAEASCVYEVLDMGGGKVDVLAMDVYPKRNVKKALKELGIEKYCISCYNVTYTIYA